MGRRIYAKCPGCLRPKELTARHRIVTHMRKKRRGGGKCPGSGEDARVIVTRRIWPFR